MISDLYESCKMIFFGSLDFAFMLGGLLEYCA